jgi:hypothetical protein
MHLPRFAGRPCGRCLTGLGVSIRESPSDEESFPGYREQRKHKGALPGRVTATADLVAATATHRLPRTRRSGRRRRVPMLYGDPPSRSPCASIVLAQLSDGACADNVVRPGTALLTARTTRRISGGRSRPLAFHHPGTQAGLPACSARSRIPRSIRWVIMKATTAVGSTRNRAHRWVYA